MSLETLSTIDGSILINELEPEQLKELQTGLAPAGYPVGEIDEIIGPKTKNAWAESKTDVFPGKASLIGRESIQVLQKLAASTKLSCDSKRNCACPYLPLLSRQESNKRGIRTGAAWQSQGKPAARAEEQ